MRKIIRPAEANLSDYSNGEKVYYLAGGTEVLRLNSTVPEDATLVDLSIVKDKTIALADDLLTIGNGVTFQDLIDSSIVPEALKKSARNLASYALRSSATVCGNIGASRDDSFLLPTLLCYDTMVFGVDNDEEFTLHLDEYLENKKGLILYIIVDTSIPVKTKRMGLTSSSHAVVIEAVSPTLYAAAVKGSGVFSSTSLDTLIKKVSAKTDMFGTAEYKEYLVKELGIELKEALND